LHSQDDETLKKSLRVLKPGGKLISISGPPDPAFAKEIGKPWILRPVMRVLSYRARKAAKRRQIGYSFLFMRAHGDQLREITSLIDSSVIKPVMDRVFPFEATNEASAYVEKGRAKGKVVVKVK
jgi:NADPH:quinone reductase-like Zn-dependent oxidoreductase